MNEEKDVNPGSSQEEVEETEETQEETEESTVSEDEKTPPSEPQEKAEEKTVPYDRFKEVNSEKAKLEKELNDLQKKAQRSGEKPTTDVDEFIEISASLEGLDRAQKEYLARQHKLTGESITELKDGEDWQIWNEGYQAKVEKEKALKPSSKQADENTPKGLTDRLAEAKTITEKEELLVKAGLYKPPKRRQDQVDIGGKIGR